MAQPADGIISGERHLAGGALRQRALRAASALHDIGVWQGDIVALLLRNDFACFEATLGAMQLGASTVPLNWHLTADEIGYILDDCGAKVLIGHADLLSEGVLAVASEIEVVAVPTPDEIADAYGIEDADREARLPIPCWDRWIEGYPAWSDAPRQVTGPMFYTSGTTGRPKGVKRKPVSPEVGQRAEARSRFAWGLDQPEVRSVMTGPLYHSAPNAYAGMVLSAGGLLILQPRFDAAELLRIIEQQRITHLHMVPTMFVRLLALPEAERLAHDLSSLRHVAHGAAPCPEEVKRRMIDWWGEIIHEYYALTETGIICTSDSATWLARPGCVGRPVPGIDLRILDENGVDMAAGEAGEICVRSEVTSKVAYHRDEDKTEAMRRGDYVATGDIGYMDGDGVVFISDRLSDMVISGGVNLYPAEVEKALLADDRFEDCAAFGVPDDEFGERLVMVVQGGSALSAEEIGEVLRPRLAGYKLPRDYYRADEMPREDSGKIKKRLLRERVINGGLTAL